MKNEKKVKTFYFPKGIYNFEDLQNFQLDFSDPLFIFFESLDFPLTRFVAIKSLYLSQGCMLGLNKDELKLLRFNKNSDLVKFLFLHLNDDIKKSRIDWYQPLIINQKKAIGLQSRSIKFPNNNLLLTELVQLWRSGIL